MEVPELYCGIAPEVRKSVRKQIRAFLRGASWFEATAGPTVSTREVPGLIYLHGPTFTGTPKRPQIYLYLPFLELARAVDRGLAPAARLAEAREAALQSGWGAAAMLAGVANLDFLQAWPECATGLLRTALDCWPVLDGEGPRNASRIETGKRLWTVAGGLHFAIHSLGVRDYPMGPGIVFEPRTFLAEHGLLERVLSSTDRP